jgi:pseudouridine-5'-phosphate glycosidase
MEPLSPPLAVGRAITPFILARVNQITGGASLEANIALVNNNARVGADIAVALAERRVGDASHICDASHT